MGGAQGSAPPVPMPQKVMAHTTPRHASSAELAAAAVELMPSCSLVAGPGGRVVAANARMQALFGERDLTGTSLATLFPGEPDPLGRLRSAAPTGADVRLTGRKRDRVPFTCDARAMALSDGGLVVALAEVRSVPGAPTSLQALDAAFDASPIGMALFDTDGRYTRVNEALCRLLGRTPEDLLGRRDQELTHPDDREADVAAAWRILEGEIDVWQAEKRFLRPDGVTVHAIANMSFLRDDERRPLCWLGQFQDITPRKLEEVALAHLAAHDELTGLANRRAFMAALELELEQARLSAACGAVVAIDLDRFKAVNDTLGHQAGDALLARVAEALRGVVRAGDVVARLGGDEFAVILPGAGRGVAEAAARAFTRAVVESTGSRVGASCGVAVYGPEERPTVDALLARADRRMYAAKVVTRDR